MANATPLLKLAVYTPVMLAFLTFADLMLWARLTELGLITYGVYLLHPLVYSSLGMLLRKLGIRPAPYARIAFALLEEPLIRLGKRLTSAPGPAPAALVAN